MRTIIAAAFPLLLLSAAADPAQAARPIQFERQAAPAGALVIPLSDAADLAARAPMLDPAAREAVARALAAAKFDGKAKSKLTLRGIGSWSQILVVGTGPDPLSTPVLHDIGGIAAQETAAEEGPVTIAAAGLAAPDAAARIAAGAAMSGYRFDEYMFADPAAPRSAALDAPLTILTGDPTASSARFRQVGAPLAAAVAFSRDLINEPPNIVYPESFADRTRAAFRGVANVTIEELDVPAMERLGMGSILSVGKGSRRPPRMLIVHYKGGRDQPVLLAGKGITFDSGGISLKPGANMWDMKGDMSGAAAVVGTVLSLARSAAPVNVVAIAALAENMPGGGATRPSDIVKAYNGRTIEVLNTDAEGRLVLADAVAYGERRFRPSVIVDIATLTGAKVGALGNEYAALFTRSDPLAQQLLAAGTESGEEAWRLPLHPSYAEDLKSNYADIRNIAPGGGPGAGIGAHFIGYFVTDATPWAHLDIAGNEFADSARPTGPKGAIGYGVRLLDRFVRDFRPVPASPR
ncbi:leucyl aminopeptidase [Sphingosinicella rhizophila]|uniref:Probable cytosol aminopeptidase n=1 Tax=Sphingosinicella rhizophila TaxID=3050082 RepID=A0ABU3Q7Q3_9SPHN|nr:leucyl aminopeptidase [Sphingosinicella sp. GR2756]MDT9599119.1 leucyl aminopeptidase [Sphingosinicella sp. GR2756]